MDKEYRNKMLFIDDAFLLETHSVKRHIMADID